MTVQAVDWTVPAPILVVAATALLLLVVQAALPSRRRLLDGITVGGLALAGTSLIPIARGGRVGTFCTDRGCSLEAGGPLLGLQVIVLVSAAVVVLLSAGEDVLGPEPEDQATAAAGMRQGATTGADPAATTTVLPARGTLGRCEYWALLLMATAGALALISSRDLLTLLVALETASLPVIGMVGVARTREAAVAATRLLLVAVASFGLTLFGVALLLAASGTVYLDGLRAGIEAGSPTLALVGVALVLAGVGYKVAALPFGFWVADVYPACPLPVAAYLSTASKVAGVAALALVIGQGLPGSGSPWLPVVIAVTMTVANVVALTQRAAIGILAWSTIGQAGWALLPLASDAPRAIVQSAVTAYLLAYCAATLAAFAVVVLVSRHHPAGRRHTVADEGGLFRREPVAAGVLVLALISLAGLPPGLAGLLAKVAVLRPVIETDGWWLAVVAAANVAIGLAYYARWVWALLVPGERPSPTWDVRPAEGGALALAAAVLVVFTILPGLLL